MVRRIAISPAEAAQMADVHVNTVYQALTSGELKGHQRTKPNGRWKTTPEAVESWITGEAA